MSSAYRIAPLFLIRLAGVPFSVVESLATAKASAVARDLLDCTAQFTSYKAAAQEFVTRRDNGLSPEEFTAWRNAIRQSEPSPVCASNIPDELRDYVTAAIRLQNSRFNLDRELQGEVAKARRALLRASATVLPPYLVFASGDARHLTAEFNAVTGDDLPARNSRARERERHLLLYLQRVAAKNDTFSEFGPSAWGKVTQRGHALSFDSRPGIARREAFFERWTAQTLAASMNSDPEIFPELCPRVNPNGLLFDSTFLLTDTSEPVAVSPDDVALLARCHGQTPVHALGASDERIRDLISKKILIASVEVPALEPFAFDVLRHDIASWRSSPSRDRWLPIFDSLAESQRKFSAAVNVVQREEILSMVRGKLAALGAERKTGQRTLYTAFNPIAEECYRECKFEVSEKLIREVISDAEPWIDFWRDTYACVAGRVSANLRALVQKAPMKSGAIALPAFLHFCEAARVPLTGPGLVGMAHVAFQEIKAAFRQRLRPHGEKAEYELSAEDCRVVRRNFDYPKFDEFTYPSADLQLAASSIEAINRGNYQWIIGELHPAVATLHHCMYWSCPDPATLSRALESTLNGRPICHFGFFAADFTAHTTIRVFDALPQHSIFVSPQRARSHWRYVSPSEVEVCIQDDSGDVALRRKGTNEDLGSIARNWVIPLGFHPFQFGMSPQMPRLRCGRVIVQRRSWTVSAEELGEGDFSGLSRDLLVATEKLRAAKDWPRFVYIRPTEQALRRSGAEGRDKDTKPVFVDLESYLFLEIFHRWLMKAGELEVTEMLPAPDDLWWQERDGRRTFELRTLIVPRT